MPTMPSRRCLKCNLNFSLFTHRGETTVFERKDDLMECPGCGAGEEHWEKRIEGGTPIFTGGAAGVGKHYPFFSEHFGIEIESRQHHKRVAAQHGLELAEGSNGWRERLSAERRQKEEEERVFKDYKTRLEEHPAYADWRKAKDQGRSDAVDLNQLISFAE